MKSITKRTQRDYSLSFKLAVVDEVEKGHLTSGQAQDKYGIQGRSTVLNWLRKHGRLDWSAGSSSHQRTTERSMPSSSSQTPEQRIKELEQKLALSEQKADFFEAVVKVLERDHGVSLTKKRPGKSSKKKS